MKKIICLTLSAVMAIGLSGCSIGKNKNNQSSNTITISVDTENPFLKNAASKYEDSHPGVQIKIVQYLKNSEIGAAKQGGDIKQLMEKYSEGVNTDLMTGKACDIIAMNDLPYQKYADKNMLVNLQELMNSDKSFNSDIYYTNIFEALKYKNGLYVMPLAYSLDTLMANKDLLDKAKVTVDDTKWTWNDFMSIGKKAVNDARSTGASDVYLINDMPLDNLVNEFIFQIYSTLVDTKNKKANFNSPEFISLLKSAKEMIDDKLVSTEHVKDNRNKPVFMTLALDDYTSVTLYRSMFTDHLSFYSSPSTNGKVTCEISDMFSINKAAKNKELAWDFLKYLISSEAQGSMDLRRLPVNKEAGKAKIQQAQENLKNGKVKGSTATGGNTNVSITDEDIKTINEMSRNINSVSLVDQKISQIVNEEVASFFSGQKSAEDVANIIQNRVTTYLNE